VDDALFDRMETVCGKPLSAEHRQQLRAHIQGYNSLLAWQAKHRAEYCRAHGIRLGRGKTTAGNLHGVAISLLMVFMEAGGRVTANRPRSTPNLAGGPAAALLRVAWEAIENPPISQEGFARLVMRAWLEPQRRVRRAREAYRQRLENAWKN
jgi:hypothetical protein